MNRKILLPTTFLFIALLLLSTVMKARGEPNGFIIDYADATLTRSFTSSTDLVSMISSILPRFVMQYSDQARYIQIAPIPTEITNLLGNVAIRYLMVYVDASRFIPLQYPKALIGDQVSPIIITVNTSSVSGSSLKITWSTNEYTSSVLQYGPEPGVYSSSIKSPDYKKTHDVTLTGLAPDTTYYFSIVSTDRSGNSATSPEFSAKVVKIMKVYIPMIKR